MSLARNVWCATRHRNAPWHLAFGCLLLLAPIVVEAQEGNVPRAGEVDAPKHPPPPWRNHAFAFAGVTNDDGDYGFTVGLNYERRFHLWYGVGGTFEATLGQTRDLVIGPTFELHPVSDLRIGLTAAGELRDSDWDFLFRIGLGYDFEWRPGWTIAPSVALDFARGQRIIVLGGTVGRLF